jgi:twitching motility protein PilI
MSKQSLSQFQQALALRLASVRNQSASTSWLAFKSAGQSWILPLASVGEVVPLPTITTMPMSQTWFSGLANVRGAVMAVSDLSQLMGYQATSLSRAGQARLLCLGGAYAGLRAALLVEQVFGLRSPDAWQVGESNSYCKQIGTDADNNTWRELDLERLILNSAFLNVQA